MQEIDSEFRSVNLSQLIRDCRLRVFAAHRRGGDAAAFQAVMCASITLAGYIIAGSLKPEAIDEISEAADNIGLTRRHGQEVVHVALSAGATAYRDLADAWDRTTIEG